MCGATGSRDSNPLVWLVFVQRPSFNAWCYRWHRFKPCGLISARLRVLISASSRGSNPLACRTGFIWFLVSLDRHRFKPCGSMIGLEAWAHGFKACGLNGCVLKGFCLERKLWVMFRVCLSCLWSPVCVAWGLLRVLLVCGDELCIVVHLALRPGDICCPSCYKSLWT